MEPIKKILKTLGLIADSNLEVLSSKTRDKENIRVLRDKVSGVIFIDDFEVDKIVYEEGNYRKVGENIYGKRDYEIGVDLNRRLTAYRQFYVGKRLVEFGCGEGSFLEAVNSFAISAVGVELEKEFVTRINKLGIECRNDLKTTSEQEFDSLFCFHTLEHLSDPIRFLREFKDKVSKTGHIIIEVPHANDFLLRYLQNKPFKDFTLWSQHLILHTRASLEVFLKAAGYRKFMIQGIQRYQLSNHLNWLVNGKPGGHKSVLSAIDSSELQRAYENSLRSIDATDTLVAVISND
tara:strand:+ start:228 stop:1103 length:876 start_codon:yes stop_codon:yes gene_type:complete